MKATNLFLAIDERRPTPLHRQIVDGVSGTIASGLLRPGDPLPSTRREADALGVHRSTVALAYQELWSLGFLDLRPGACARVRDRPPLADAAAAAKDGAIDWARRASPAAEDALHRSREIHAASGSSRAAVSFRSLEIDRRLFPLERFRACLRRALARVGPAALAYGDPMGYPPLRESVAARLRRHGISVAADEVLITNGSQQGIDLVLRMLAAPGRCVAVESPTYDYLLPLLRLAGLRAAEVPLRADGMDLDALEATLRAERPVLVYTMPTFHNPTGACTAQAHRERLLALAERCRVPVLEDGFEEEMKYAGRVVLPLKSMDRQRVVIYCGTFSKVLFPGLRIGWVAADRECIARLAAIRRFAEVSPNTVLHAAVDELCRDGSYDRHVARMHRVFRRRMQVAVEALGRNVKPEWAEWAEPRGGFLLWLKLRRLPARLDVAGLLAAHGVEATLGRFFFASPQRERYLRLSIARLDEDEIRTGIARLGRALREAYVRGVS